MPHYPEHEESLWMLAWGPALWALHFLLCYGATAILCARVGSGAMPTVKLLVLAATLLAGVGIVWVGIVGYRRHRTGASQPPPHEEDTPGDRHRFLGFATALLCSLSAVATLGVGAVALFFDSCR